MNNYSNEKWFLEYPLLMKAFATPQNKNKRLHLVSLKINLLDYTETHSILYLREKVKSK